MAADEPHPHPASHPPPPSPRTPRHQHRPLPSGLPQNTKAPLSGEKTEHPLQPHMQKRIIFAVGTHSVACQRHFLVVVVVVAEEPIKGGPPQHSNMRHHPSLSLSLCSPSISLGRLTVAADNGIDSSFLFLYLARSGLSPPSTILLAAFPFQNGIFYPPVGTSARLSRWRRRWLLSGRLPHSSPSPEFGDTILCRKEKICWRWQPALTCSPLKALI